MNNTIKITNSPYDIVNGIYERLDEPINGIPAFINQNGVLFYYTGHYFKIEKDERELVSSLNTVEWSKLFIGI